MLKKKIKIVKKVEIDPLFKIGDTVFLKDNLLPVEIRDIFIKAKRYCYQVRYSHKHWKDSRLGWFEVFEDSLETRPVNYEARLMEKYIEYKCKYENLLFQLTRGNCQNE